MQKFTILQNLRFSGATDSVNSGYTLTSGEQLTSSNNYLVYKDNSGGGVVNNNNVRDFLDKDENQDLAKLFVEYLEENTNFTEFKEIFYNNKKLADTFNEYYKNKFLSTENTNNSISNSLKNTREIITQNTSFDNQTNRNKNKLKNLNQTSITGDSYFLNIQINKSIKTSPKGDYSEYFKDEIKGSYLNNTYTFINKNENSTIYGNIPYLIKLKNNNNINFGYAPISTINSNTFFSPFTNNEWDKNNYYFKDYDQFSKHLNYQPESLTSNTPGIYISQKILSINSGFTTYFSNEGEFTYTANFNSEGLKFFNKTNDQTLYIPITITLNNPSTGTTTLNVTYEQYSTAILGNDFVMDKSNNSSNTLEFTFLNGEFQKTKSIIITNQINTEDTIILSLNYKSVRYRVLLEYLIIRCEEFIEIKTNKDMSYLLIENNYENDLYLNSFVRLNYNNGDLEFYRDYNMPTKDHRKIIIPRLK